MTETLIAAHVSKYKHLSNFKSVKDFNNHYAQLMTFFKDKFTKADIQVIKLLKNYAAYTPGVTNISPSKLSEKSKENGQIGFSTKTAKRTLKKLVELGAGIKYRCKRWNGSDSSSVFVFNRIEVMISKVKAHAAERAVQNLANKSEQPKESTLDKVKNLVAAKQAKAIESRQAVYVPLDPKYTDKRVPERFRDFVKNYHPDALKIEEFWKRVEISGKKYGITDIHELEELGVQSFKELVKKMKKAKKVSTEMGYFYGILKKKIKADIRSKKEFLGGFFVPPKTENESANPSMDEYLYMMDGGNTT